MTYIAGFISGAVIGFWAGVASIIVLYCAAWAAWFYGDRLIWNKVRAAEKAAPHNCDVIVRHSRGAR